MRINRMWNVAHIPVETHLVQFVVTPPTIWIIDGQLAYTVRKILVVSVQKLLRNLERLFEEIPVGKNEAVDLPVNLTSDLIVLKLSDTIPCISLL